MSFFQKTKCLEKTLGQNSKDSWVTKLLLKLNNARNSLAHNLNFSISGSEIDQIGYILEKEYLIKKWEVGADEFDKLLIFIVDKIYYWIMYEIYQELEKSKKAKPSLSDFAK